MRAYKPSLRDKRTGRAGYVELETRNHELRNKELVVGKERAVVDQASFCSGLISMDSICRAKFVCQKVYLRQRRSSVKRFRDLGIEVFNCLFWKTVGSKIYKYEANSIWYDVKKAQVIC